MTDFAREWLTSRASLVATVLVVGSLVLKVVALGVIPGNRKPSTGMAWLLLILLNAGVGLVAFAFFGSTRLGRRRSLRIREVNEAVGRQVHQGSAGAGAVELPEHLRSVAALNRNLALLPMLEGNDVELMPGYGASVAAMTDAVRAARDYVHVEFYIAAWDELTDGFFRAMAEAAERGVRVRFLFDHLGSRGIPGYAEMTRRLAGTKVEFHPMLPIRPLRGRFRRPDLRNHRKLLVVDGEVGFTGSQNLTEPGYNKPKNHKLGREWVELMVCVRGPVVASLEAVFASDWYIETEVVLEVHPRPAPGAAAGPGVVRGVPCQLVPSGPGYVAENNLRMFNSLIYGARRRLSLTSPYFVPDESLLYAVTTAAHRGVDVELFVSEVADQFMVGHAQASYYRALLEAGVRIYRYPAPFILHSKHLTVDDDVAVLGSSNMDMRSFSLNYEVSLLLVGDEVVARMRAVEDDYRSRSVPLTLEEWERRPARTRYVDNVMRLTAALQ